MSQTLTSKTIDQSSSFCYLAAVTHTGMNSVLLAVRSIPDNWDSISKSELVRAGELRPMTLAFLLEQDVLYCTNSEQERRYRQLLLDVRGESLEWMR